MNQQQVLEVMRAYFAGKKPPEALESFSDKKPQALMKDSMEVVDFIVELEDKLGYRIDINQVGQTIINKNFGDLAAMLAGRLTKGGD